MNVVAQCVQNIEESTVNTTRVRIHLAIFGLLELENVDCKKLEN